MTKCNDTEIAMYDQITKVKNCIDALKDIYQNIPDEDRYSSVLSIVGERLEFEFDKLYPLIFK